MQKVLIWDNSGDSPKWIKKFLDMKDVEIVRTITPAEPAPEILLRPDAWDWLLIFERKMRATFDTIINTLKLPTEKIVYVLDTRHWLQRPKAITAILNDSRGGCYASLAELQ